MTRMSAGILAGLGLLAGWMGAFPAPAGAQAVPALAGAEVRTGLTFPEAATAALGVMVEGDVGYFLRPELRILPGVSHFRANIDREPGDNEGSFRATGFWLGARYDLLPFQAWGGYVRGAVTLHRVTADAWDPAVGRLLSGTSLGVAAAAGGRYALDARGRLSATLELRRTLLNNLGQTSLELGVRVQRRGVWAYVPDAVALGPGGPPLIRPPAAPATPPAVAQPPAVQAPAADTAAARAAAEAAARDAETARAAAAEAARVQAERGAVQAAELERLRAAADAERAAAAQARLRQGLDRAAAVMTSVAAVRETPAAFVVTVGGGAFASGASTLSAGARAELRSLALVLAGYPGHIVTVEGHTDSQGDAGANQRLSQERAAAVRAALIVEGVDALWTAARGFGEDRPIADNATAAGRALNRRVEIHVSRTPCPGLPAPAADGTLVCAAAGAAGPR